MDTAQDYKSSEKLLGVIGVNDFNIISKIKVKENTSHSLQVYFKNKVLYSLKKLKIKSLYGLLIETL